MNGARKISTSASAFLTIAAVASILILAAVPARALRGEGRPVLGVAVFGNYGIDRALVIREFGVAEGDTFSVPVVNAGLRRIESLHGVRHAGYSLDFDPGGHGVFILIEITEERSWSLQPLASRNFADRIAVGAAFRERNLRGRNEELYLSAMVHGALIAGARWTTPRPFGSDWLSAGIRLRYRDYDWPYPSFEGLIPDERIRWFEGSVYLASSLTEGLIFYAAPGIDWIDASFPGFYGLSGEAMAAGRDGMIVTLSSGLEYTRIDRKFYPRSGVRAGVRVKNWGMLQGDPAFSNNRTDAGAEIFLDLGRPLLSVVAGATLNEPGIPYYLYEHLGGVSTIRGHEFGVFYGENSALVRTDLRVPLNFRDISELGNPIFLVDMSLLVDTGAVWDSAETMSSDLFYSGAGVAMSLIVKEGWLLKLGHAWPMDTKGRWFFDIGTMF